MSTSAQLQQAQSPDNGSGPATQAAPGHEQAATDRATDRPGRYLHAPALSAPDVPTVPRGHGAPIVHDPRLDEAGARLARQTVHVSETARQVRRGYSPYALPSNTHERRRGHLARWRAALVTLTRRARAGLRSLRRVGSPDRPAHESPQPHQERGIPRWRRSGAPRIP